MKASHSLVALVLLASLACTYCIKCYTYTDPKSANTPAGVAAGDKTFQPNGGECADNLLVKSSGKCFRASSGDVAAGCAYELLMNCKDLGTAVKQLNANAAFFCSECDKDWCNNSSGLRAGFFGAVVAAVAAVLSLY